MQRNQNNTRALINTIKKIGFVKKLRTEKWKRHTRAELFTTKTVDFLEKHPEKITEALYHHMKKLPDKGKSKLIELDKTYQESPLSKRTDIDEKVLKEDILFWHFAYGFTFNEYVSYQFIEINSEERRTFLSDRDIAYLCYDLNDIEKRWILVDKAKTYSYFKPYFGREVLSISQESDLDSFLAFINRHRRFIKKDAFESCGRSVELIDLKNHSEPLELFNLWVQQGKTILEELIVQSKDIGLFNQSSVNTLRVITFLTNEGVVAPFSFFKTGREGSFVDNGAAGGLFVSIDEKTGLLGMAVDENGNRYERHPDSGVQFKGFQLPDWKQAVDLCCVMSAMIPEVRIIGWDLAHTDHGWIAVEGNSMTEAIGPQSTSLCGMRRRVEELKAMM